MWSQTTLERLSDEVRQPLAEPANTLLLSTASTWEIVIKYRIDEQRHALQESSS
jgi:PIN domain nuclease of toxin-antitoxin system